MADLEGTEAEASGEGAVALSMQVRGKKPISDLVAQVSEIDGVIRVGTLDDESLD